MSKLNVSQKEPSRRLSSDEWLGITQPIESDRVARQKQWRNSEPAFFLELPTMRDGVETQSNGILSDHKIKNCIHKKRTLLSSIN